MFIILAARIKIEDFAQLNLNTFIFLGVLVFVARPLSVFVATMGQNLNFREKLFLSLLAPRGIVAAAVASIFSIELLMHGYAGAERLIPLPFMVIVVSVS